MTRLRYSLLLLAAGGFVSGMSMRMAEPLLPKVAADLNSTISQASILITSFSLAYGLFQLLHGPLGDRIGKLRAVTGAMALAALARRCLRDEFALSYTRIGLLLAGFGVGSVLYSIAVGTFVRRLGARRMVLCGGTLLLAAFTALSVTQAWQPVLPAIMALGLAFYLLHNTLQTLATEMSPSARGSAISAFAFCLFSGQAIGVTGAGLLAQWLGYRAVFAIAGIALALLAAWFARRLHTL